MRLPVFLQPLHRRLPLLISGLLLAVVVVFSSAAHGSFERALLVAGRDRVGNASQRLAGALAESSRRARAEWRRLAEDSALHRFLRGRAAADSAAVRATLARWDDSIPLVIGVDVRDVRGRSRLSLGFVPGRDARPAAGTPGSFGTSVSSFALTGDTVFFETSIPVVGAAGDPSAVRDPEARGDTLGHLVYYRRVAMTEASAKLIGGLIAGDAIVRFGNRDGSVWTDLTAASPGPAGPVLLGQPLAVAGPQGEPAIGVATAIEDTPWVVLVAIPRAEILRPARELLDVTIGLAALVLVAGGLGAWLIGRQIGGPLAEMTHAAEGIARGDYSRRVTSEHGVGELARLAASFNGMASQIQDAAHALEERVAERTNELEQALRDLHAAQDELVRRERLAGEARYRRLVETAHEGVWTVDRNQITDYVNPRLAALLGYAPDEMVGRSMLDFLAEEAREAAREHVARRRRGIAEVYETTLLRRDGTKVVAFLSASPIIDDAGEYAGALAMVTDLTEHRKLEAQVRQAQKMEAVGQLAGGVAHDFNNLLTVIKGFTTFLLEDLPDGDPRRDDVKEIDQAAGRAAALTRQLLAFSRRQMLEPRLLDLNDVVKQIEKMLRRLIPTDIQLRTRLDPSLALVEADPGQLEQVIMNLAVNARDAMPDGGTLTISTENAELRDTYVGDGVPVAPGHYAALVVTDTGCGMDEATQRRIFEPFFTTKEKGKGTGLGLSTAYGIVKQSGGYVLVESEPGKGTTFRVYLPRAADVPANGRRADASATATRSASETILLVEDDEAVRSMARRVLGRSGYDVLEATTGAEALRICAESGDRIDLILSDLVMPEMGGRELAEKVRARHPNVRLLFMSGYTEDAVMRRSFLDPSESFLPKPFTPTALAEKVREVLDKGTPAFGLRPAN